MKLYVATRVDEVGYDEYDGFAVLAPNRERALELVKDDQSYDDGWELHEVDMDEEGIVLDSFKAG